MNRKWADGVALWRMSGIVNRSVMFGLAVNPSERSVGPADLGGRCLLRNDGRTRGGSATYPCQAGSIGNTSTAMYRRDNWACRNDTNGGYLVDDDGR